MPQPQVQNSLNGSTLAPEVKDPLGVNEKIGFVLMRVGDLLTKTYLHAFEINNLKFFIAAMKEFVKFPVVQLQIMSLILPIDTGKGLEHALNLIVFGPLPCDALIPEVLDHMFASPFNMPQTCAEVALQNRCEMGPEVEALVKDFNPRSPSSVFQRFPQAAEFFHSLNFVPHLTSTLCDPAVFSLFNAFFGERGAIRILTTTGEAHILPPEKRDGSLPFARYNLDPWTYCSLKNDLMGYKKELFDLSDHQLSVFTSWNKRANEVEKLLGSLETEVKTKGLDMKALIGRMQSPKEADVRYVEALFSRLQIGTQIDVRVFEALSIQLQPETKATNVQLNLQSQEIASPYALPFSICSPKFSKITAALHVLLSIPAFVSYIKDEAALIVEHWSQIKMSSSVSSSPYCLFDESSDRKSVSQVRCLQFHTERSINLILELNHLIKAADYAAAMGLGSICSSFFPEAFFILELNHRFPTVDQVISMIYWICLISSGDRFRQPMEMNMARRLDCTGPCRTTRIAPLNNPLIPLTHTRIYRDELKAACESGRSKELSLGRLAKKALGCPVPVGSHHCRAGKKFETLYSWPENEPPKLLHFSLPPPSPVGIPRHPLRVYPNPSIQFSIFNGLDFETLANHWVLDFDLNAVVLAGFNASLCSTLTCLKSGEDWLVYGDYFGLPSDKVVASRIEDPIVSQMERHRGVVRYSTAEFFGDAKTESKLRQLLKYFYVEYCLYGARKKKE